RPDRAEQHLASMQLLTGDRVEHRIEVATMEAAILDALGRTVEATDAADRAVALAEPRLWLRLLVDVNPTVTTQLGRVSNSGGQGAHIAEAALRISNALDQPADKPQPLVDPLTARELEVLAEVAAGLTNAEIAECLYISVGTTKRHVANIFVKLTAKHRAGAVARARTLGIIE
ncbi:MAG: response regulator transcription factor, partial [Actinomycetia bacterium]|nr:response regulator transcription factor [Actinomycetes bacterium]